MSRVEERVKDDIQVSSLDEEVDEKGEEEKSKFWEKVRQVLIYLVLSSLRCLREIQVKMFTT